MQTASGKYTFGGVNITISIYFDLKVFALISPPMKPHEETNFIRLICDSLAAATPKDSAEKHFYIKRVTKNTTNHTLKLLCTDGFLIDTALIIPITQQAFSEERIKIGEVDQLPSRLNLSNEVIKNVTHRLSLFEEEAQKEMGLNKVTPNKETVAPQEKPAAILRPFIADRTMDILSEINNTKKEIHEMSEHDYRTLKALITQVDGLQSHLHNDIIKEKSLAISDNQKQLNAFAMNVLSASKDHDMSHIKEILTQKMDEIASFPNKIETITNEISQRIHQKTNTFYLFKKAVIDALYESAKQYQQLLSTQLKDATPNNKKIITANFNKKFAGIATLSGDGELSSPQATQDKLMSLTLEDLQDIISKEDKDYPGLLQKCNTSWTEESSELQIAIKNLSHLNKTLPDLFKNDEQFSNQDMIQITRVPFPRSFQFKFTPHAFQYKNHITDFCHSQKDIIADMTKEYKKILQIDEVVDNTKRGIAHIQQQATTMKTPIVDFSNLLKLKESSDMIVNSANQENELAKVCLNKAKQIQDAINASIDANQLKSLAIRINLIINEIQHKTNDINAIMPLLNEHKNQIDLTINKFSQQPNKQPDANELSEKIKLLEKDQLRIHTEYKTIQQLQAKLASYEDVIMINDKISSIVSQSDIISQKNEAKILLLQFIKNKNSDAPANAQLKKDIMNTYTLLDSHIANIDLAIQQMNTIKNQLFSNLNHKPALTTQEVEENNNLITEKIQLIEAGKREILDCLSKLKTLSMKLAG